MPQTVSYEITDRICACLRFMGDWNSSAAYAPEDLVLHDGATWLSQVTNVNSEPDELNSDWELFAGTPTP